MLSLFLIGGIDSLFLFMFDISRPVFVRALGRPIRADHPGGSLYKGQNEEASSERGTFLGFRYMRE